MSTVKYFAAVLVIAATIFAVFVGAVELLVWLYHTYQFHPVGIIAGGLTAAMFCVLGVAAYLEQYL